MRKLFFTYFFFSVYLLALVKPMLPVLDYYMNYDYIATKLCENRDKPTLACNGRCYVAKEIEKNEKSNHSDLIVPGFKIDYYFMSSSDFTLMHSEISIDAKKSIPLCGNVFFTNTISFSIFHPPRLLA